MSFLPTKRVTIAILTTVALILIAFLSVGSLLSVAADPHGPPLGASGQSHEQILVTDPLGRMTGCEDGHYVNQIPTSFYSGCNSEPQIFAVLRPETGSWTISWVGIAYGPYKITVYSLTACSTTNNPASCVTSIVLSQGEMTPGQTGSASFDETTTGPVVSCVTVTSTATVTEGVMISRAAIATSSTGGCTSTTTVTTTTVTGSS